jgi:hypothetical protein
LDGRVSSAADREVLRWGYSSKGAVGSVVVIEVLEGVDALGDVERQVGAGVELVSPGAAASPTAR